MNNPAITKKVLICFTIIVLPFFLLFWLMPFISDMTIGHDYLKYPIRHQMELFFSIEKGSFPLYMPGFGLGHSSAALTLGQPFHPSSHLASLMPGYWDGKAIEWNNFFKFISLGITHLALFLFLKKIRLNSVYSFLLSFITVYNLRMLGLYHYGAPLEAYTGFLILCVFIGRYFIDPKEWFAPAGIMGGTYLLICSGHPEEMYYGLMGAGLFILVAPFFLSDVLNSGNVSFKEAFKFWFKVSVCLLLGIMLSSAYILHFYSEFLTSNIHRVGQDYAWTNSNLDYFFGTINNFFLPLKSEVHSAFGGPTLFLIAATLPFLRLFGIKIPRSVWVVWSIFLFAFLHMQGERTPVHRLVWEYVPFASSIRDPGRISTIIPFFIMILLSWIIKIDSTTKRIGRFNPLTLCAFISALLIIIYYLIYFSGTYIFKFPLFIKEFNPAYFNKNFENFRNISFSLTNFRAEFFLVISGLTSLLALVFYNRLDGKKTSVIAGIILIAVILFQVGTVLKYRSVNFAENIRNTPSLEDMEIQKKNKLDYLYYSGSGLHSSTIMKQMSESFVEPFLGKIFTLIAPVESQDEAYELMKKQRLPQKVFIENYNLERAKEITDGSRVMQAGSVSLVYSSFNRVQFRIDSEVPAMFGLSYPYTGNWKAWVNGKRVRIYRANGAAHAVEIPQGESTVEFRYWSNALFLGMIISCSTFLIIGIFLCYRNLNGLSKAISVSLIVLAASGVFILWYNSLYNGDNLKTEYKWTYTPPLKKPNLAYGKRNWVYASKVHDRWSWRLHALEQYKGRLVDGDISPDSGFVTCYDNNPAWFVDLQKVEKINNIVFHQSNSSPLYLRTLHNCSLVPRENLTTDTRILDILFSDNGIEWSKAASITSSLNSEGIKQVVLKKPQKARFVQIKLRGKGQLRFDEIEIYGE